MRVDMVSYCPGDSVGSPAGLPRGKAERQRARDAELLGKLLESGAMTAPVSWPHLGECARGCRWFDRGGAK